MKNDGTFKLLTKTSFIYLIFTFIAFFASAYFLTNEANEFIKEDLEHHFRRWEHKITRDLNENDTTYKRFDRLNVEQLSYIPELSHYPVYTDTLIYNNEQEEEQYYREKTIIIRANNNYFKVSMVRSMDDFIRLRDDIFSALIPAFILLAIAIVLFNYFLSGFIFKPFNKILGLMKTYKVGQSTDISKIKTNTSEFKKMQNLFHQMVERIEYDYRHLKEYTENMAHEIQTPLSIIRNKAENLISDERVMDRHSENVKIIYDQTNHLSKLGNTLNLLTKIENREFNKTEDIKTKPEIEKHIKSISELAELKSLNIETELSEKHTITIDPFLLDIILKNLLRNAVSYGTTDGSILVKTTDDKLIVSNYGEPLDFPSEKLFERFFHNNYEKSSIGLGLALIKKICDLNGLDINYVYKESRHIFIIEEKS